VVRLTFINVGGRTDQSSASLSIHWFGEQQNIHLEAWNWLMAIFVLKRIIQLKQL